MIDIYTRSDCNWSFAAKRLLMMNGLQYTEHVIDRCEEARVRFEALGPPQTVPRVLADGQLLGGFDDLQRLADDGGLKDLAAAP